MKILYLTNLYPPHDADRSGSMCAEANRAMRARGHQTLVLTSNHGVKEHSRPEGETGVRRNLRLNGFMEYRHRGIIALHRLELRNNALLREAITDFRPDVVHVFNLRGLSKSLALTLQRLDVPTVYSVSDHWIGRTLNADAWLDWWNRRPRNFPQRALRKAWTVTGCRRKWDRVAPTQHAKTLAFRRIYFASEFLRNEAIEAGRDVAHGVIIHPGIDATLFAGPVAPREKPLCRLLYAGPLTEEHGVLTLLRAMTLLRDKFEGELTLCGSGKTEFEAQLHELVLKEKLPVHFRTATPDQMPAVYREHDALIFPSKRDEPFASTPLEAMACGLPVVTTTTGASAEFFTNRVNALTFPPGQEDALAQQILWFQGVPSMRETIARRGQSDVRVRFGQAAVMNRIEAYLRETVGCWSRFSPDRTRLKAAALLP